MEGDLVRLEAIIGVPFSIAGAVTAFLVAYAGYARGSNPDKRLALRMALQTGLVALVALGVVLGAIAFFTTRMNAQN